MTVLKYRMATKLIAIYDCIFSTLALIVLFGLLFGLPVLLMFSPAKFVMGSVGIFVVVLPTVYYIVSFLFALNLLRSTKTDYPEEHVYAVTSWILYKIAEFLLFASVAFVYCVWNSPTPYHTCIHVVLGMLPAALFLSIPMYFVYQYKMELG